MSHRSVILHPVALFCGVWVSVSALYLLHLSKLLSASNKDVVTAVGFIVFPYLFSFAVMSLFLAISPKQAVHQNHLLCGNATEEDLAVLTRRLNRWLLFWAVGSIVEVVVSGGFPLLWLFTGSSKTYFDFGIKSVHGVLNSLLLSIGLCHTGIYARYGNRKHLLASAGVVAWAVLLVTRSMIIVNLIQTGIAVVLFRGISKSLLFKLVAAMLLLVIGFGAIGDIRTGGEQFRTLAEPTEAYPTWLPSGVLWVYIYLTTPLNNLIYTMSSVRPIDNPLFPNTTAPLFPSIIRIPLYGDALNEALSGDLPDSTFNVSTAYIGPFQDFGFFGMACFGFLIAGLATYYWRRGNFRDILSYVVVAQCLLISVFYNHFFSLPIITQLVWLHLFFVKKVKTRRENVMHPV